MKENLKILMLEDDINDAKLIEMYLRRASFIFEATLVSTKEAFINRVDQTTFDVILSDHELPQFNSLEALQICNQKKIYTPFILVTGAVSEEFAVTILQEGASDYVLKDRLHRLPIAISQAIEKQKIKQEKYLSQQELKKSNERFELVSRASNDVIWDFDIKTGQLYLSTTFTEVFGHPSGYNLRFEDWTTHIHPEDKEWVLQKVVAFHESSEWHWHAQYRMLKSDGSVVFVNTNGIALRDEENKPYRITGCMQDITQIRNLQEDLLKQKLNRQKEIAETTLQAQEKERNEIGKELHDNVSQTLATAKIMIDTALDVPDIFIQCLHKSREALMLAINDIRSLSHTLVPPSFERDGFFQVINELAENINFSGKVALSLDIADREEILCIDDKIKLTLYRIIQEQINNVIKYARATQAHIKFKVADNLVHLIISDDGVGFNAQMKTKGIGLRNIASRVELYSGKMEIKTAPGKGFILKVQIPCVNSKAV